ncbi:hypothetical protein SAICODRAFT_25076 [Saitoella complicata NRRL Y-17804]|uniref:uncharacterized protein n=1 Tax=Saitoella complicata (strain BCRC 22490 / CBS 7301 / JCM 7358 / NBRC 10748 / NRRL Y-17804) TaxID=698492 RepID=UPI000866BD02|nr:uncharacterized protein SAICODRAFT_25076 [Saitoella complicata NRRL Y-17804]ODQ53409.1 hypothetical protein SAICODRAFT_25076 [Saitoella complicata NRRL Y-17804]
MSTDKAHSYAQATAPSTGTHGPGENFSLTSAIGTTISDIATALEHPLHMKNAHEQHQYLRQTEGKPSLGDKISGTFDKKVRAYPYTIRDLGAERDANDKAAADAKTRGFEALPSTITEVEHKVIPVPQPEPIVPAAVERTEVVEGTVVEPVAVQKDVRLTESTTGAGIADTLNEPVEHTTTGIAGQGQHRAI